MLFFLITFLFGSIIAIDIVNNKRESPFISPLAGFLTLRQNNQATLLDLWLPFLEKSFANTNNLSGLTAKSILMYDITADKTIYEKNAREKMPMASLTKIMTAIVAFENPQADDRYVVHKEDIVGEDSMGLEAGEVLTLKELLLGLILHSGNDAAETLAHNYPEGREAFIKAMNDKVMALALTDTRFSNPTGLQGDGEQYTTAYDLLVITKYALEKFPLFDEVAATISFDIPKTQNHKEYLLDNETNLLSSYPGVKGVKTGYTPEAGLCLVTYLDYGGHRIIGIILNSENRRQEMKNLLDYSLENLGIHPPKHD